MVEFQDLVPFAFLHALRPLQHIVGQVLWQSEIQLKVFLT